MWTITLCFLLLRIPAARSSNVCRFYRSLLISSFLKPRPIWSHPLPSSSPFKPLTLDTALMKRTIFLLQESPRFMGFYISSNLINYLSNVSRDYFSISSLSFCNPFMLIRNFVSKHLSRLWEQRRALLPAIFQHLCKFNAPAYSFSAADAEHCFRKSPRFFFWSAWSFASWERSTRYNRLGGTIKAIAR